LEVEADIEVFELKKQIIDLQSILDAAPLYEEGEAKYSLFHYCLSHFKEAQA
jgi:hypothetical protein